MTHTHTRARQEQNHAKNDNCFYEEQNTFELWAATRYTHRERKKHAVFWFNIFEYKNIHKISLIIQMVPNGFLFSRHLSPFAHCSPVFAAASVRRWKKITFKKNPEMLLHFRFQHIAIGQRASNHGKKFKTEKKTIFFLGFISIPWTISYFYSSYYTFFSLQPATCQKGHFVECAGKNTII